MRKNQIHLFEKNLEIYENMVWPITYLIKTMHLTFAIVAQDNNDNNNNQLEVLEDNNITNESFDH